MNHSTMIQQAVVLLLATLGTQLVAQDTEINELLKASRETPPQLASVFEDKFATDSRNEYQIEGTAQWLPGKLNLAKGTTVKREFNGGWWAKVRFQFQNQTDENESLPKALRVTLGLDKNGDQVCLDLVQESTKVCSVSLGKVEGRTRTTLRQKDFNNLTLDWVELEYRDGLISFGAANGLQWFAYRDNLESNVGSFSLESISGSLIIERVQIEAIEETPLRTSKEVERLRQASAENSGLGGLLQRREMEEALASAKRILKTRLEILGAYHVDVAQSIGNLATILKRTGEYEQAEKLYKKSTETWEALVGKQHSEYLFNLHNLGVFYFQRGEQNKAAPLFKESSEGCLKLFGAQHDRYLNSLEILALCYRRAGDYVNAERTCQTWQDAAKAFGGEQNLKFAHSLNQTGLMLQEAGDYSRARGLFLQAGNIRKSILGSNHSAIAECLSNTALTYVRGGDYLNAEALYLQALEVLEKSSGKRSFGYAMVSLNLSGLYSRLGDKEKAIPLLVNCVSIFEELEGRAGYNCGVCLNNLASIYDEFGLYEKSEPLFLEAIEIKRKARGENHPEFATVLNNLASHYERKEALLKAREYYEKSLEIRQNILGESHPLFAQSKGNVGRIMTLLNEPEKAANNYKEAISITSNLFGSSHPNTAAEQFGLAELYFSQGKYDQAKVEALIAYEAMLDFAEKIVPGLSESQARKWIENNSTRPGFFLTLLRKLNAQGDETYPFVWNDKLCVDRLRSLSVASLNGNVEALELAKKLRRARQDLAKVASTPQSSTSYLEKLEAASDQKETLEKELARVAMNVQRDFVIRDASVSDLLDVIPAGVAVIDFAKTNDLVYVDEGVSLAEGDGTTKNRMVKKAKLTPVYDAFVLKGNGDRTKASIDWVELGAANEIEKAILNWRRQFAFVESEADEPASGKDPATTLRSLVWDKLETHLDGVHTIVVIPDAALNRLPWAALPGRNEKQYLVHDYAIATASSGQQLFASLADSSGEGARKLLAVGGIKYDEEPERTAEEKTVANQVALRGTKTVNRKQNWNYLPGTASEVEAIADLFGNESAVRQLDGRWAGERLLAKLLPQYRFVHLATHGFFDNYRSSETTSEGINVTSRNPLLLTGVVLAGANLPSVTDELGLPVGDDGVLTAEEIAGLDLRKTELVTLSACETGLGNVAAGQGVYGLSRVLHQSGVRSVMASLWKVDDRATTELMKRFYTNLWVEKQSKVEALQNAQLWMIENAKQLEEVGVQEVGTRGKPRKRISSPQVKPNSDPAKKTAPFFWAAFQLSGDFR